MGPVAPVGPVGQAGRAAPVVLKAALVPVLAPVVNNRMLPMVVIIRPVAPALLVALVVRQMPMALLVPGLLVRPPNR